MSDSLEHLRHQIASAGKLGAVVRTMKAMAAANIAHFEHVVDGLAAYRAALDLALGACLRLVDDATDSERGPRGGARGVVAFGSDQGLVGDFNDTVARAVAGDRDAAPGPRRVWAVGARLGSALDDLGLAPHACLRAPVGMEAVGALVGELVVALDAAWSEADIVAVDVFGNEPGGSAFRTAQNPLLPLDAAWRAARRAVPWPTRQLPEALDGARPTLTRVLRQHLFVTLYAACARSLAAENTKRLLAMQRAERNIDELVDDLGRRYHRQRQAAIDDELFDVVAGFEALRGE